MKNRWTKWKMMFLGLTAAALLVASAPKAGAAVCADLNNNGTVNNGDALLLLQVVSGANNGSTFCGGAGVLACGDMNADGAISIADVVILLNALSGNPTLFPLCSGTPPPVACPGNVLTISGNVQTTQTWPAQPCTIFIDGSVFVQPGVVVTIKPGALIQGRITSTNGTPSVLVFTRGSKIVAKGTPALPIIMQSDGTPGHRGVGDWGGLVLNGKAPVNCPGGECLAEGLIGVPFGGTDPFDSSGALQYTRIEFSGIELSPDNELNILTQNGVGSFTQIDHVQANVGFDDCIEWFGGTVKEKYMVASACGDDGFDWQLGTTVSLQYGLMLQYEPFLQNLGNHGFEGDNNENGFNLLPRSNPNFCNITLIGTASQPDACLGDTERGAMLRRGTAGKIANTIIMNYKDAGLQLNDNTTGQQACAGPSGGPFTLNTTDPYLVVENTLLYNNGFFSRPVASPGCPVFTGHKQSNGTTSHPTTCTHDEWYALLAANPGHQILPADRTAVGPDPLIPLLYPTLSNNATPTAADLNSFIPAAGSPAASGFTDCSAIDPAWFDSSAAIGGPAYLGAFKPGGSTADNWLVTPGGWISFELD